MLEKMKAKDKRALKLGAFGILAMIAFLFVLDTSGYWAEAKDSFNANNSKLEKLAAIDMTKAQYAGLVSVVPVFEMPEEKETQKFLFQDALNEQFKKANVKSQPWEDMGCKNKLLTGYDVLSLKTTGKCNFTQLLDLLANLKTNPYLVSVEELLIKRDPKNKQQVDYEITLSTPVKKVTKAGHETRLRK